MTDNKRTDIYQIVRIIGRGNFGIVHLVKHKDDGKYYVLKQIPINELSQSEKEGAVQEVKLLSGLQCPFIVQYKESFLDKDLLHIVMHYCEGGDLHHRIKQAADHFREEQILDWFVQLVLALHYCHRKKIIHRDIKTQNVFLTKRGNVRLGDFGIARVLGGTTEMAMSVVGTPYSMSPEVCENKPYSYKSDIWALGCVLYELCTLKHAFDANNLLGLVWKIVQEAYPPVPDSYSTELRDLIKRMLSKDPHSRPYIHDILKLAFIQKRISRLVDDLQPTLLKRGAQKKAEKQQRAEAAAAAAAAGVSVSPMGTGTSFLDISIATTEYPSSLHASSAHHSVSSTSSSFIASLPSTSTTNNTQILQQPNLSASHSSSDTSLASGSSTSLIAGVPPPSPLHASIASPSLFTPTPPTTERPLSSTLRLQPSGTHRGSLMTGRIISSTVVYSVPHSDGNSIPLATTFAGPIIIPPTVQHTDVHGRKLSPREGSSSSGPSGSGTNSRRNSNNATSISGSLRDGVVSTPVAAASTTPAFGSVAYPLSTTIASVLATTSDPLDGDMKSDTSGNDTSPFPPSSTSSSPVPGAVVSVGAEHQRRSMSRGRSASLMTQVVSGSLRNLNVNVSLSPHVNNSGSPIPSNMGGSPSQSPLAAGSGPVSIMSLSQYPDPTLSPAQPSSSLTPRQPVPPSTPPPDRSSSPSLYPRRPTAPSPSSGYHGSMVPIPPSYPNTNATNGGSGANSNHSSPASSLTNSSSMNLSLTLLPQQPSQPRPNAGTDSAKGSVNNSPKLNSYSVPRRVSSSTGVRKNSTTAASVANGAMHLIGGGSTSSRPQSRDRTPEEEMSDLSIGTHIRPSSQPSNGVGDGDEIMGTGLGGSVNLASGQHRPSLILRMKSMNNLGEIQSYDTNGNANSGLPEEIPRMVKSASMGAKIRGNFTVDTASAIANNRGHIDKLKHRLRPSHHRRSQSTHDGDSSSSPTSSQASGEQGERRRGTHPGTIMHALHQPAPADGDESEEDRGTPDSRGGVEDSDSDAGTPLSGSDNDDFQILRQLQKAQKRPGRRSGSFDGTHHYPEGPPSPSSPSAYAPDSSGSLALLKQRSLPPQQQPSSLPSGSTILTSSNSTPSLPSTLSVRPSQSPSSLASRRILSSSKPAISPHSGSANGMLFGPGGINDNEVKLPQSQQPPPSLGTASSLSSQPIRVVPSPPTTPTTQYQRSPPPPTPKPPSSSQPASRSTRRGRMSVSSSGGSSSSSSSSAFNPAPPINSFSSPATEQRAIAFKSRILHHMTSTEFDRVFAACKLRDPVTSFNQTLDHIQQQFPHLEKDAIFAVEQYVCLDDFLHRSSNLLQPHSSSSSLSSSANSSPSSSSLSSSSNTMIPASPTLTSSGSGGSNGSGGGGTNSGNASPSRGRLSLLTDRSGSLSGGLGGSPLTPSMSLSLSSSSTGELASSQFSNNPDAGV